MAEILTVQFRDRVAMLQRGETQWGCDGMHAGNGSPDCPRERHHHHDIRCELPTRAECLAAGVPPRAQWDSRA